MRKIIVGSRSSKLAMTQTKWVIEQLKQAGAPYEFEIKNIITKGDRILDVTLSKVGGKGLFVKEIEQQMIDEDIDFAVHSMKDLPSELPTGLIIGATPSRVDARDALITTTGGGLDSLPEGAIVGTSSLRRGSQLLKLRPDLKIESIRGNIDTRLEKLKTGPFDGILLAAAGLQRMGWSEDIVSEYISTDDMIPAVGQGILAIECRANDQEVRDLLNLIHDQMTEKVAFAERSFLAAIEGSCHVPVGGFATINEDLSTTLVGFLGSVDGQQILLERETSLDPMQLGQTVATRLLDAGGREILASLPDDL
ncbi:hydroxymethylbilane synthase [Exiguobacterium sp. PvP048]|uniref:Porphobilinogen deaminase n=1 Tax=Exiguobacterium sibiricum (strain DSM 17290 / CCUG 55495 / CIP 109462 / JCM 13490 / 255-15) TaxID=262543 RepID=HEM3_EXIS2|nr:hydroxymethylbilane synthase [Exiguobacterium sibiricum]B1YJV1.1 RecName: Full=Porphobilinogen deaminase; Short=PBG; AltName: Full=Hydroxymethylbilane synthase; Short=HMBS; AltName: Full=Pre-uroporphyrinogen synthase [Exiguobacterium sibiricum 255-15]ACB61589.1 porphobilinogen deaminase [Exiguobacterium sibiricum 255-15]